MNPEGTYRSIASAALLASSKIALQEIVESNLCIKPRRKSKPRSPLALEADVLRGVAFLFSMGTLKRDESRRDMFDFSGNRLMPSAHSVMRFEEGTRRIAAYITGGFLAGNAPAFPEFLPMTEEQAAKARGGYDADKYRVTRGAHSDDQGDEDDTERDEN